MISPRRVSLAGLSPLLVCSLLGLCVGTSLSCTQHQEQSAPACTVTSIPAELEAPPYYQKYCNADDGLPVLASGAVSDDALVAAGAMAARLLGKRPELHDALAAAGGRIVLLGEREHLLDLPEAAANIEDRERYRDYRGVAFNSNSPPIAVAPEENVLCWPTSDVSGSRDNTLLHELGHLIHLVGLAQIVREGSTLTFQDEVVEAYVHAIQQGLWADTYAATDEMEYWAEGVVIYFSSPEGPSATGMKAGVKNRAELREHDPELFELLHWAFGEDDWYPTCPRPKPVPLAGHACAGPDAGDDLVSFPLLELSGTSVSGTAYLPEALKRAAPAHVWVRGLADDKEEQLSVFGGGPLPSGISQFHFTIENVPPGEYLIQLAVRPDDIDSERYWVGTHGGEGDDATYANAVRIGATPRCDVDVTLFVSEASDDNDGKRRMR